MSQFDFQRFFDLSVDMLSIASSNGYFKCINDAFEKTLGWSKEELLARPFMEFIHPDDVKETHYELEKLNNGVPTNTFRNRYQHKDGSYRHILWTAYPDQENKLLYAVAHDATDLIEANEKLATWAYTDPLTNIPNRRSFDQQLNEQIELMKRMHRPLSLLMMDVDRFKSFNDCYGHPAGDEVLIKISGLLKENVRSTDVIARYGGEEFCTLLPDTDALSSKVLAKKIREKINAYSWPDRVITLSVGIGTLDFSVEQQQLWPDMQIKLVNEADQALYQAKASGRNTVIHYDEIGH